MNEGFSISDLSLKFIHSKKKMIREKKDERIRIGEYEKMFQEKK